MNYLVPSKMKTIIQILKNSRRILMVTHERPDGDALGSLLALGYTLTGMHKHICMFTQGPIPSTYSFLPGIDQVISELDLNTAYDAVIVLDCSQPGRIGNQVKLMDFKTIINIDHHISNTNFGDYQLIDTQACATAEIIYGLIKAMHQPLTIQIASALYVGILSDTGFFRFSNTNQTAFEICGELVGLGINAYDIARRIYGTYSLGYLKLLSMALETISISPNGKVAVLTVTQTMLSTTNTSMDDVKDMINYVRLIENIQVAALVVEVGKKQYYVSLRSDGQVDVAAWAAVYGGGGHAAAAGFKAHTDLETLKNDIFDLI